MQPKHRTRLLLLDLDDTILDNMNADVASFQFVLTKNGLRFPSSQIVRWRKRGMYARTIFKRILSRQDLVNKCLVDRAKYLISKDSTSYLKLKPDTVITMRQLKPWYHIVIITSRHSRTLVEEILRSLGVFEYVDGVLCGEDYGHAEFKEYAHMKELLYKIALDLFRIRRDRCAVVGNLKSDIIAGLNLGIPSYAVRGSYRFDHGIRRLAPAFANLSDVAEALARSQMNRSYQ